MKYLILLLLIGCGMPEEQVDKRESQPSSKRTDSSEINDEDKINNNTNITIVINELEEDDEELDNTTVDDQPEGEDDGLDDTERDSDEFLPILFSICSGIIVDYGGDLFYIGETPKKIGQSWVKVKANCRLRLGYNTVEQQEKIGNDWVLVE